MADKCKDIGFISIHTDPSQRSRWVQSLSPRPANLLLEDAQENNQARDRMFHRPGIPPSRRQRLPLAAHATTRRWSMD